MTTTTARRHLTCLAPVGAETAGDGVTGVAGTTDGPVTYASATARIVESVAPLRA